MKYIGDRKQRGITQKLFLIETLAIKSQSEREYVIMGSTGNVYNVTISCSPSCTCPDFITRKNRCKHIFFVLLRIMKVTDPDKEEYSSNDIVKMFSNIPEITNVLCVGNNIKDKYERVNKNKQSVAKKEDDICPICLDDISNGDEIEFCKAVCGTCVHKLCFSMWCIKNQANCLICKSPWNQQKYVNLANDPENH